jgi:hypothetical protein
MLAPSFPAAIPLADLRRTHPEYSLAKIQKHNDLYRGGDGFRKRIANYLVKRQVEEIGATDQAWRNRETTANSGGPESDVLAQAVNAGAKMWDARKRRAWYKPVVAGMIDFLAAAIFQAEPSVVAAEAKENAAAPTLAERLLASIENAFGGYDGNTSSYWHALNRDADGAGQDLAAIMRDAGMEVMLHRRAYLAVRFPRVLADPAAATLQQQIAAGEYAAQLYLLRAADVDDWACDERGELLWLRIHRKDSVRSFPWKEPDTERHIWTYVTSEALYEYRAEFPRDKPPPDKDLIALTGGQPQLHNLGAIPIIPVTIPEGLWIMERLAETVIELFNRQASLAWHLDQMAFAMLVIASDRNFSQLLVPDLSGLHLGKGESAQIVGPDAQMAGALERDIERLKQELFLELQAMVLIAAARDEQGRQSGVAKQRDFGSLSTLLGALASPLRDALERAVSVILKVRRGAGLDLKTIVAVQGMDKYDVLHLQEKLKNAVAFLAIPGVPDAARRWVLLDSALAMTANAPAEIREQVVTESLTAVAPAPAAPVEHDAEQPESAAEPAAAQLDINGAVVEGVINLIRLRMMTVAEAREKLGLTRLSEAQAREIVARMDRAAAPSPQRGGE